MKTKDLGLKLVWVGLIQISIGILVAEYAAYSRSSDTEEAIDCTQTTTSIVTTESTTDVTTSTTSGITTTTFESTTASNTVLTTTVIETTSNAVETEPVTQEPQPEPKPEEHQPEVVLEPIVIQQEHPKQEPIVENAESTIVNSSSEVTSEEIPQTCVTEVSEVQDTSTLTYVKRFTRGTFYHTWGSPSNGGSGRFLLDCSYDNGDIVGSIASSYLYSNYSYNYNGQRTKVYLEIYDKHGVVDYSFMNGWYYVDDCDAWNPAVIDFYYTSEGNCPYQFRQDGVVDVECWI